MLSIEPSKFRIFMAVNGAISAFATLGTYVGKTTEQGFVWLEPTPARFSASLLPTIAFFLCAYLLYLSTSNKKEGLFVYFDQLLTRWSLSLKYASMVVFVVASFLLLLLPRAMASPYYFFLTNSLSIVVWGLCVAATTLYLVLSSEKRDTPGSHPNSSEFSFVLIGLFVLGLCIRLLPLLFVDINYPYSLGGLFVEFSKQILSLGFTLPDWIPYYTEGGLPYAYPPLPFFIEAFLLHFFPSKEYLLANVLPPLFTVISLFLFVPFVKRLGLTWRLQLASFGAFVFLPSAFIDQIESAGLSESIGTISLIAFFIALWNYRQQASLVHVILLGVSLSLCALSSPGSAYFAGILMVATWLVFSFRPNLRRKIPGLLWATLVATAISAIYWLPVLNTHGLTIFLDSITHQNQTGPIEMILGMLWKFRFVNSTSPFLWGLIALAGFLKLVFERNFVFPLILLAALSIPSEGIWMASIPLAIVAGHGLILAYNFFSRASNKFLAGRAIPYSLLLISVVALLIPVTQIAIADSHSLVRFYNRVQWKNSITAMEWVSTNLPQEARLVPFGLRDPDMIEWMPTVAERTVLNVIYGTEWKWEIRDEVFHFLASEQCMDFSCLAGIALWVADPGKIYFFTSTPRFDLLRANSPHDSNVSVIYQPEDIVIFKLGDLRP